MSSQNVNENTQSQSPLLEEVSKPRTNAQICLLRGQGSFLCCMQPETFLGRRDLQQQQPLALTESMCVPKTKCFIQINSCNRSLGWVILLPIHGWRHKGFIEVNCRGPQVVRGRARLWTSRASLKARVLSWVLKDTENSRKKGEQCQGSQCPEHWRQQIGQGLQGWVKEDLKVPPGLACRRGAGKKAVLDSPGCEGKPPSEG